MELARFFAQHPAGGLAFSGGVDSAYLLSAAMRAKVDVGAYFVKTEFQPQFELDDARRLADQLGAKLTVLELSALAVSNVAENPENRCYFCKKAIFSAIIAQAKADGYKEIWDGTNASDDPGDRPGIRALRELSVLSPLRLCGLTKGEIRAQSKASGLFTWDKPAYACLATRVPTGMAITQGALQAVEAAEGFLFESGYTDFRVRITPWGCNLQLPPAQMAQAISQRTSLLEGLSALFETVTLDLKGR